MVVIRLLWFQLLLKPLLIYLVGLEYQRYPAIPSEFSLNSQFCKDSVNHPLFIVQLFDAGNNGSPGWVFIVPLAQKWWLSHFSSFFIVQLDSTTIFPRWNSRHPAVLQPGHRLHRLHLRWKRLLRQASQQGIRAAQQDLACARRGPW